MKTKLRFGIVGIGTHGRGAVVPAIEMAHECELVAIADPHEENLRAVIDPSVRRYRSLEQMLRHEALDVVYIATLASSHCKLALEAFHAGAHVVCEKPLASSVEEAQRMVDAAEAAGRKLVVMFESRSKPHYQKIREWIGEGAIGRVEAIHLQSFGKHPSQQPRRTNLLNEAGCLDCGIHMLDLIRFWMGGGEEVEWEEVTAMGTWFGEEVRYAPHLAILARIGKETVVTFEDSFSYGRLVSKTPWNFHRHTLAIIGTHGVIVDGNVGGQPCFQLVSDERMEAEFILASHHRDEISEVVDAFAVHLKDPAARTFSFATGHDGLSAQKIVDEVNRQCIARRPVAAFA